MVKSSICCGGDDVFEVDEGEDRLREGKSRRGDVTIEIGSIGDDDLEPTESSAKMKRMRLSGLHSGVTKQQKRLQRLQLSLKQRWKGRRHPQHRQLGGGAESEEEGGEGVLDKWGDLEEQEEAKQTETDSEDRTTEESESKEDDDGADYEDEFEDEFEDDFGELEETKGELEETKVNDKALCTIHTIHETKVNDKASAVDASPFSQDVLLAELERLRAENRSVDVPPHMCVCVCS
jgi:hypothetical protein